jgi:dTDP-4-dehydrorhamnose 3,5-epimerase
MIFTETKLAGVFVIEPERLEDDRGFFARVFDKKAFADHGIEFDIAEASTSFNKKKGTLRGMHYQVEPYGESKIVRCTMGKIYDVVIDLRKESGTFKRWFAIELSAENRKMLFIPNGFAHGFITMEDNTEISYHMDQVFKPDHARGIRWDDGTFNIVWPMKPEVISAKDSSWKDFVD